MDEIKKSLDSVFAVVGTINKNAITYTEVKYLLNQLDKLHTCLDAQSYREPALNVRLPGQKVYDALIDEVFIEVSQGISREGLIEFVMEKFNPDNDTKQHEFHTQAALVFWLEAGQTASSGWLDYKGGTCHGIHLNHWDNYKQDMLPQLKESPLLAHIVRAKQAIELQFFSTDLEGDYQGEFDKLFRDKLKLHKNGFWLSAIPLIAGSTDTHQYASIKCHHQPVI